MADDKLLDKQSEMEAELLDHLKAKRKAKRNTDSGKADVTLNSMMDMMTIILVFLLKSYGEEPITILPNTDVPISTGIFLLGTRILDLSEGKVPANFKKGGEQGLIIEPLEATLRQEVEKLKGLAQASGKQFDGDMTIIADQSTNYRLLVEVMQTAIGTEFKKFRFAVIQGGLSQSGRAPVHQ